MSTSVSYATASTKGKDGPSIVAMTSTTLGNRTSEYIASESNPTPDHSRYLDDHESGLASNPTTVLETIDPGYWTRRTCKVGLAIMYVFAGGFVIYGSVVQSISDRTEASSGFVSMKHHTIVMPIVQLAVSFTVTAFSDIAGLVHSTSLRFTLLAEQKLIFNSNLRLFTSCHTNSRVHWWPVNLLWAWSLLTCYACGSMVLLQTVYMFCYGDNDEICQHEDIVSGYALIFLGFGLLGQASIATWALKVTKIPTWSTNPILIANVYRSEGYLARVSNRTMLSVHDADDIEVYETPSLPKPRQGSLFKAHALVRKVIISVWIVTLLAFLWFIAITIAYQLRGDNVSPSWGTFSRSYSNDWSLIPDAKDVTAFLGIPTSLGQAVNTFGPWFVCKYLLTCSFVAGFTLSLHIVELLVQCSRDETLWRRAATSNGLEPQRHGAFWTAFTSWQTIVLFIFKTLIHWLFSLAFGPMWEGIEIRIPQVCYTAVLLFLLALLSTGISLHRPNGPQPATFGHLPTLIDLIDVWPCKTPASDPTNPVAGQGLTRSDREAVLFWGDKGTDSHGVHRAGTAIHALCPIQMEARYL
jgi:hypothetical protein